MKIELYDDWNPQEYEDLDLPGKLALLKEIQKSHRWRIAEINGEIEDLEDRQREYDSEIDEINKAKNDLEVRLGIRPVPGQLRLDFAQV